MLVICLAFIFLIGCNQKPNNAPVASISPPLILSSKEVRDIIIINKITPWDGSAMSDLKYAIPSEEWVEKKFPIYFNNFLKDLQFGNWMDESNDCDDFAKMAASFARLLNHNTPKKEKETSIAFGEFYYKKDYSLDPKYPNHAINFALVRTKLNTIKIIFFEPQEMRVIKLSEKEIRSCLNWLL